MSLFEKFLSRHYHLTVAILVISTVALFTKFLSGEEFATIATVVLGTFRVGDIFDTYLRKDKDDAGSEHS